MKRFFILTVFFILFFTACSDGSSGNDNISIGDTGPGGGTVFFAEGGQYKECSGELGVYNWSTAITMAQNHRGGSFNDWWLPDQGELDLMYVNLHKKNKGGFSNEWYWSSTASSGSSSAWAYNFNNGYLDTWGKSYISRVRAVRSYTVEVQDTTPKTTLVINNQSFTEITDVIWNNVSFANNQYENSIKSGTGVNNEIQAGGGYIFFKRKLNPLIARTADLVIVEKGQQAEFTFTNNTLVVEVNNPGNTGTLSSLPSTVVWWDDAEGEMQPYTLKQSFVGYYSGSSDLLSYSGGSGNNFYPPKNGKKSIAVGGTNTAVLQLKINLAKNAKLSFWYANKSYSTEGTVFSINGDEKAKWITDINWSFLTFDLQSGENDLVWEKKDGIRSISPSANNYLSLDDILIYYTE